MRWSIVRLIWLRELRDQLRDRRTLFMIVVLPVFLYPVAGVGLMQLAAGFLVQQNKVAVVGSDALPQVDPAVLAAGEVLACTPSLAPGGPLPGLAQAATLAGLGEEAFPPLLTPTTTHRVKIRAAFFDNPEEASDFVVEVHDEDTAQAALATRQVDLIVVVPKNFEERLRQGGRPILEMRGRPGDDRSRLVQGRLARVLNRYRDRLKEVRLARAGLPPHFDEPFEVRDAGPVTPGAKRAADELFKLLTQIFPFVLVMWSLAGALYPAIDLCAGEKERGTMETLLISPASREEIVWGKFLTIWVFSAATALLNLFSMGVSTWVLSTHLPDNPFRPSILLWGVVLLLPLSAFFSALGLAIGVYARSSKEGQYYLMPLFLATMPLVFLTMVPGVELNHFYSMVPVTGVALLLQELMRSGTPQAGHWAYFAATLLPMMIYSWLALRWAVEQFQREEVLFREAERFDMVLWMRSLFREKEALPSVGQALFCFCMVLALTFLSQRMSARLVVLAVNNLAFVATPALFMALLLTKRPLAGLRLRLPPWWGWPAALLLAVLLFLPGAELTWFTLQQLPGLRDALREKLDTGQAGRAFEAVSWHTLALSLTLLAFLQALCEEVTFRGFILSGLGRRFRPWTAVLLSAFLFALFQMNVFQALPHFLLGVLMGFLVQRTGSLWPAVLFHFAYNALVYNVLLLAPTFFPGAFAAAIDPEGGLTPLAVLLGVVCAAGAASIPGADRPPRRRGHPLTAEARKPTRSGGTAPAPPKSLARGPRA